LDQSCSFLSRIFPIKSPPEATTGGCVRRQSGSERCPKPVALFDSPKPQRLSRSLQLLCALNPRHPLAVCNHHPTSSSRKLCGRINGFSHGCQSGAGRGIVQRRLFHCTAGIHRRVVRAVYYRTAVLDIADGSDGSDVASLFLGMVNLPLGPGLGLGWNRYPALSATLPKLGGTICVPVVLARSTRSVAEAQPLTGF
jgi:hypothetical protein